MPMNLFSSPSHTQRSKKEKAARESERLRAMRGQLERHLARQNSYRRRREREGERGPNGGRNILEILSLSSLTFFFSFCSSFLRLSAAFVGLVCLMGSCPGSTTTTTFDQVSPKREGDCGESR